MRLRYCAQLLGTFKGIFILRMKLFHLPYSKYKGVKISVNQYLLRNLGYKQKIQVIQRNQVYFILFQFIQLVLDNDCCISRNVGRIKVSLVKSNNLYILCENMFLLASLSQSFSVVSRSRRSYSTRVALVSLVSGTRVVNQTRS